MNIFNLVDEYIIDRMKININLLGNNKCWEIIERFTKVETRLAYRKYFFKAGGYIPK